MRTTIDIPDEIMMNAMTASGMKTKTATIVLGLKEVVRKSRMDRLLALRGRMPVDVDLRISRQR
jgi:Arc/MetJ family transcription regulator